MSFTAIAGLSRRLCRKALKRSSPVAGAARAAIEALEQRRLLATIVVTDLSDSGPGTLRNDLAVANPGDTIQCPAGTITLTSGELFVNQNVTITGPTSGPGLTISGNSAGPIFAIGGSVTATINYMTITAGSGGATGGAITNAGDLTLGNTTITGNTASFQGGAIYQSTGSLTVTESTVSNNSVNSASEGDGGAIFLAGGSLNIDYSTFASNSATGASDSNGGAIGVSSVASGVSITISDSTFASNSAQGPLGSGGAIALDGGGSMTVVNATFASNSATVFGGGISGTSTSFPVTLNNTILALNTAGSGPNLFENQSGTFSGSNNLIDNAGGVTDFTNGVNGNLVGVSPQFAGGLASNGGATQTIALAPGSPAIDAGNTGLAPATDQRGLSRVRAADIGAYEYKATPSITSTPVTSDVAGTAYTYNIVATDPDSTVLSITATQLPSWLTLTDNGNGTATLSGTPSAANAGANAVSLQVADSSSGLTFTSAPQSFSINVTSVPTLTSINTLNGAQENQSFTIPFATLQTASNATVANGDTLSFIIESVTNGTLTEGGSPVTPGTTAFAAGQSLVWTPATAAFGTIPAFTVVAFDGTQTSTPPVAVNIQVQVAPPVANNDSFSTGQNEPASGNVLSNDTDPSNLPLTATLVAGPAHGTLEQFNTDGSFVYLPNSFYSGNDTFTYTAADSQAQSGVATVTIHVNQTINPGQIAWGSATETVNENAGTANVALTRAGGADGAVTVTYTVTGGTAVDGTDFQLSNGTVSFADGQTTADLAFPILVNPISQPNPTIVLTLSNPTNGSSLAAPTVTTVTIQETNGLPSIAASGATVTQPISGTVPLVFTLTLSVPSSRTITVDYATADGTATVADNEYQATSGTITFAPHETSKTVTVQVNGTTVGEPTKIFYLDLTDPSGATLSTQQAVGTILNTNPLANSPTVLRTPGANVTITGVSLISNANGAAYTFTVLTQPTEGTAVVTTDSTVAPTILYHPNPGAYYPDSFTYSATSSQGISDTGTITVVPSGAGMDLNPFNTKQKDLVVNLVSGTNTLRLLGQANGSIRVVLNGHALGRFSPNDRVIAFGGSGTDTIDPIGVNRTTWLIAGSGSETLIGSQGNVVMVAGSGNDVMQGRHGRTVMIGGSGTDSMFARYSQSLMIAGATIYNPLTAAGRAAIADIASNWFYGGTIYQRIAKATASKGLGRSHAVLSSSTIIQTGSPHYLYTYNIRSWCIGAFTNGIDQIFGKHDGDVETDI